MNKKVLILTLIVVLSLGSFVGCGAIKQATAKNIGGEYTIELPKGEKLVNITWKDNELWYLTRDLKEGEEVETYKFKEDSTFGVLEGTVTIKESK